MKKYNLSKIMKRAWTLVKEAGMNIFSALREAWKEAKNMANEIKNVALRHFDTYNWRRYSTPWVCLVTEAGKHDFSHEIGTYTGEKGREGALIVFHPEAGQVYGWGQKDYRGNKTEKNFCKWTGTEFVECDKLGNDIFTICGHKFYEGKIGMGILYLCTIGLFGIGWILDIISIAGKPNPYYV